VMDDGVRNMTWEIHGQVGTFCGIGKGADQGATAPWGMTGAKDYLKGRTGTTMTAHWNSVGVATDDLRDKVVDSIVNNQTPAVVGIGFFSHYPLAYQYAKQTRSVKTCLGFLGCWTTVDTNRSFYINQGWEGGGNTWIAAETWFVGRVFP
jgi:hypothetical protein